MEAKIEIKLELTEGLVLRFLYLQSHYRQPVEFSEGKMRAARKALRRLFLACSPTDARPPLEIVQAIEDDLNTPKAIALMHGYRKKREGEKLFASLRFLGFTGDVFIPSELKTIPEDQRVWSVHSDGFETKGLAQ